MGRNIHIVRFWAAWIGFTSLLVAFTHTVFTASMREIGKGPIAALCGWIVYLVLDNYTTWSLFCTPKKD